jgi:galactokinase
MKEIISSSPGRVCLFGEDVDYMNLEVITVAINQRIEVRGQINNSGLIKFNLIDLQEEICFNNEEQPLKEKRDYIRSAFNLFQKHLPKDFGANINVTSDILIGKGISSSSAFCSALVGFFNEASNLGLSKNDLAWNAYLAEVVNLGEPGGMMDQYASVFGDILYLECRKPYNLERLSTKLTGMVIGDTLTKKETLQAIKKRKEEINQGIRIMEERKSSFDLISSPFNDVLQAYEETENVGLQRLVAIMGIRDVVRSGYQKMKASEIKPEQFAELINNHHFFQQNYFENVTQKMQDLIEIAKNSGSLGCKLLGSGNGGSFLAYSPGKESIVAEAINDGGGHAYILKQDKGLEVKHS